MDKKWIPKTGEKYWYVSVPRSWNFEDAHPKHAFQENNGTKIFDGNNYFKTEDEAIKKTNEIRALWGYAPYKKSK